MDFFKMDFSAAGASDCSNESMGCLFGPGVKTGIKGRVVFGL